MPMKKEKQRLRDKVVVRGRVNIEKKRKDGNYIEWLKEEQGLSRENTMILNKDFLQSLLDKIEENRLKKIVYTKMYKEYWLNEWRKKRISKDLIEKSEDLKRLVDLLVEE